VNQLGGTPTKHVEGASAGIVHLIGKEWKGRTVSHSRDKGEVVENKESIQLALERGKKNKRGKASFLERR